MAAAADQLPMIDFSGVAPSSAPERWAAARAQVMAALRTHGFFEAQYPALAPELRARLFGGAVRPLFALPADAKRRNSYGPGKPFHGYLGGLPGLPAYESLAIVDGHLPGPVQAFADLVFFPDSTDAHDTSTFCESVHGAASRMAELEGVVRRMVMEGLVGAAAGEQEEGSSSSSVWQLFRMSEYGAPVAGAGEKEREVRYGSHQDTNCLSVICQDEVDGLEMQTRDGHWALVQPEPEFLVVMAGNALRAWSNDRVHAPFHRVSVGGEETRYSAMLFSVPGGESMVRPPEELVDEEDGHPRRFRDYDYDEFVRFCVSEEGARHQDKLKAYCGL